MPDEYVDKPDDDTKLKDIPIDVEDESDKGLHLDNEEMSSHHVFVPFGVHSFEEFDAAERAEEATDEVREDSEIMLKIVRNILNSDEDDKTGAITKVASEFSERVATHSDQMKSSNSLVGAVIKTLREAIENKGISDSNFDADAETDTDATHTTTHTKQNCKTEGGVCYPAKDYAFVPDSDKPSTWKLRLSQSRPGNITKSQLGAAAAAFSPGGFRGSKVKIPAGDVSRVKARIRREYRKLGVSTEDIPDSIKTKSTFMVWKDKSGRYVWLAKYSNNFRDDDSPPEIISAKSHQDFTDGVHLGKYDYPELRLWHRPEWVVGKSTWLAWDDIGDGTGFALAAGLFNPGMEEVAKSLVGVSDLGVSHGMPRQHLKRDSDDPTIITNHVTKEISILPLWSAANRWTDFIVIDDIDKEKNMTIPDELKTQAEEAFGLDGNVLAQIEAANKKSAAKNQDLKIEFKAKDEATAKEIADDLATLVAGADAETETVDPDKPPTRKEVAAALIELQTSIVEKVTTAVSANLIEKLAPFMDAVKEMARDDDDRLREKAASTPRIANLSDLMKQGIAASDKADGISEKEAAELGKPKEAALDTEDGFIEAMVKGEGDQYLNKIVQDSAKETA